MCSEQRSLQLRISFSFCFLFLPQQQFSENKSYAWTHKGMRLMQDGATSNAVRKTVNLLQPDRINGLAIQITDLNRMAISTLCTRDTINYLTSETDTTRRGA